MTDQASLYHNIEIHITLDDVKQSFTQCPIVFDFIEFALLGHSRKILRILNQLEQCGTTDSRAMGAIQRNTMQEIQFNMLSKHYPKAMEIKARMRHHD